MKNTKKLVLTAILFALMFVFAYTPIGTIPILMISISTIFILVAVGIVLLDDFVYSTILGLFYGIVMFVKVILPYPAATILDPLFINPLVSILPRFLVGVVGYLVYKVLKNIKVKLVRYSLFGALVALLNTIFTLSSLILIYYPELSEMYSSSGKTVLDVVGITLLCNALPELVIGAIILPIIIKVVKKTKAEDIEE